jgi:hypothetical protein
MFCEKDLVRDFAWSYVASGVTNLGRTFGTSAGEIWVSKLCLWRMTMYKWDVLNAYKSRVCISKAQKADGVKRQKQGAVFRFCQHATEILQT